MRAFRRRFSKMIFETVDEEDVADSFVWFGKLPDIPSSFFENNQFKGSDLEIYSFFNYQKTITLVAFTANIDGDISFVQT